MKSDIFVVSKEDLNGIQQFLKDYSIRAKEKEAQVKQNSRELAQVNRKCNSLSDKIDRLKRKKKQADSDRLDIVRMQQELDDLTKQAHDLAQRKYKADSWTIAGAPPAKELSSVLPVWVPVGDAKVLMNWKIIGPLNKLLREFEVELVLDHFQSLLRVRYYTKRTYKFRGEYTLRTLSNTPYDNAFGKHAPTCSLPEWIDTRVA